MPRQLAFDLPVRAALGRDDFFVSPANAAAVALIDGWRGWPNARAILQGPPGSGKTHLASIWAAETHATVLAATTLVQDGLDRVAEAPALVVEDADRPGLDETALFHLVNIAQAAGTPLLITATQPPARWPLSLADLQSRMQGTQLASLGAPDDILLQAVLLKLFADRQLLVSPSLLPYLTGRMERSFAAARALVAALDAEGLAQGRPVTRTLALRVLDKLAGPGA